MRHGLTAGWSLILAAAALSAGHCVAGVRLSSTPAAAAAEAATPAAAATVSAIDQAQLADTTPAASAAADASAPQPPQPVIVKAQVLLARAHSSVGAIDGLAGSNFALAVTAFEAMNGLPTDGELSPAVWAALQSQDRAPVAAAYTITRRDVAGPFYPDDGEDLVAASKLRATGYSDPAEELAARFHMSEALLRALNPGQDFTDAGAVIAVVQPDVGALPPIHDITVDKDAGSVRAYDRHGDLVAGFPASVGSAENPSPSGEHRVVNIEFDPVYTYDPARLTWGPRRHGRFTIKPGPNNPVGVVWIGLNAPTYGIHGSPDPDDVGKAASHGCVRLTNWDARLLAAAVRPGTKVDFVGRTSGPTGNSTTNSTGAATNPYATPNPGNSGSNTSATSPNSTTGQSTNPETNTGPTGENTAGMGNPGGPH